MHKDLFPARAGGAADDRGHARFALVTLMVVYTFNIVDRSIINILVEPIKRDLRLSDLEIGLLTGIAFALLYATMGIPIARIAEKRNRISIISLALAVWSAMTMLCGAAQNFLQLFLARIGVGIGEAGCTPAAHSVIADYYPPERRATALGIYSLGLAVGQLAGTIAGGWIAAEIDWRAAFLIIGFPGVVLALFVKLALREPPRGRYDPPAQGDHPSLGSVVRRLFGNPVLVHLTIGVSLATMANAGINAFIAPLVLRGEFGATLVETSFWLGIVYGACGLVATGLGGWLSDVAANRNRRLFLLLPAAAFFLIVPIYVIAFHQSSFAWVMILIGITQIFLLVYVAPTFASVQNAMEPRMRASAAAIIFMILSLVGYGFGPPLVGWLSDLFSGWIAGDLGLSPMDCAPEALRGAGAVVARQCREASFSGLRWALIVDVMIYVWAGIHYLLAAYAATARRARV